jgi:deoxycytidine triphosphate deaminase
MATLGKPELIRLAEEKNLLGTNYKMDNFKSASYDLRIGTIFKGGEIHSESHKNDGKPVKMKPSEIITLLTLEVVNIPNDCIGTVFAPNSMSSTGFLILNPGHIDPGWKGPISICAINLSKNDIYLYDKQSIFTLVISKLDKKLIPSDLYLKSTYDNVTRREYENSLFSKKFSGLSNSFFDLITSHEDGLNLFRNLLRETITKRFRVIVQWIIGFVVFASALYGALSLLDSYSSKPLFNSSEQNKIISKKDTIINKQSDSLKLYKENALRNGKSTNEIKNNLVEKTTNKTTS